jgi:hypothetical protein
MRCATGLTSTRVFLGIVAVLVCWLSTFANYAEAQGSQGQNAVCTSSSGCSTTIGTSAFIDASMFANSPPQRNICAVLNFILSSTTYPASGAVIDARGIPGVTPPVSMTCTASPWAGITSPPPSTVLLPAGTIAIQVGWVLPSNTHLFGQGDNIASGTVIQACTPSTCTSTLSAPPMIQFGSSSGSMAVAIEKLVLDGQGQQIGGIVNRYSQSNSYVDHVSLYRILGTGLLIEATGSGPYSNINFDTGNATANSSTVCAQIIGTTGTAGIRGLNCTSELADALAAVLLDASSNSIKDVTIVGFRNGILVGSNAAATSNVLINVIGDTTNPCYPTCPTPINAVQISNNNTVTDLTIIGLSNQGGGGTFTIEDSVTSTTLSATTDPFVGIYALGKAANNGHARFTTSPTVATWAAGTMAPTSTCSQGSLYSCTGGTSGESNCASGSKYYALWGCPAPGGTWMAIK